MKNSLKHAGRAMAAMLPAGLLAQLGMPTLAALVFLTVIVLGVTCWIINSADRSDRVIRMLFARRGDTRCPVQGSFAASVPASRPRRPRSTGPR
jgi:hypothetical protein